MRKILSLCLFAIFSCNSIQSENINTKMLLDIFTMPNTPMVNGFDNFDFYKDRPCYISESSSYYGNDMKIINTRDIDYQVDSTSSQDIIHVLSKDASGIQKSNLIKYIYDGNILKSMIVFDEEDLSVINHKDIITSGDEYQILLYRGDILKEKYTAIFENDLIISYQKERMSSFSGEWKTSYKWTYSYDDDERLIRLFEEDDKDETTFTYEENGIVKISDGSVNSVLEYNNIGILVRETTYYPTGGERDKLITTYEYQDERIIAINRTSFFKNEKIQVTQYSFDY